MEIMTNVNVRMSLEDKEKATTILESMGLNMSTLVNMTVKQLIQKRKIPFEIVATNNDDYLLNYFTKDELDAASKELAYMENHLNEYKSYDDMEGLITSLNED